MKQNKHILVVAPHADDEVLGVGGTIANHALQKDDVYLCILTKPYGSGWSSQYKKHKPIEIRKSNKILGIRKTFQFNYHAAMLDVVPQKDIISGLRDIVSDIKPDIVYIPFIGDLHRDHRIAFEASLVAVRPYYCTVSQIFAYETLSETEWGSLAQPFTPTVYSNISNTIQKKFRAMEAYASELKEAPHPRSLKVIEALAIKRGSECNMKFAEAFVNIRTFL